MSKEVGKKKEESSKIIDTIYTFNDKVIKGFFKDHRFLSNFEEALIEYEGIEYLCSEAAYQASKSPHKEVKEAFIGLTGTEARKMGRKIAIRPDWDKVKLQVMLDITRIKFNNHRYLAHKLIKTGDRYLEETNYWGDKYWGVCDNEGNNCLGHILMKVRSELKQKAK